ncbi:MAG: hypothetical protein AAFZ18_37495 [Myxococcota bacterium]
MTVAQLTFWVLALGLSAGLTLAFYRPVRRLAQSPRDSLLAAAMAAGLCATGVALGVSFVVHAVSVLAQKPSDSK